MTNNSLKWNFENGEITETEKNTCCFTGHRVIPAKDYQNIYYKTKEEILMLIEKGVNKFICGGAIGYDLMCGEIVLYIRKEKPHIKLEIAVPYKNQAQGFSEVNKKRYERLLKEADKVTVLSGEYYRGCLHARNRYMADNSSYIIAYCTKTSGGSYYTLEYARKKGIEVLNNLL